MQYINKLIRSRSVMSFTRKVVVVTGASSGIGAATAILFAKEGAQLALVARNETKLNNVAKQCSEYGTNPLLIKADVANEEETKTIIKRTVDHFKKLDVLVNNAGMAKMAAVTDPNILETYDLLMNTNLRSIVQLTSLAAPHLAATKGNIVNVSSTASLYVMGVNWMSYAVSKIGIDHFTRYAALELAVSGVRVNSVNPGPVRTDGPEHCGMVPVGASGDFWKQAESTMALGRIGEPEEIADLIMFLASDKARSITGSNYLTDNGSLLGNNNVTR